MVVQFEKEASQTRDFCVAKDATIRGLAQVLRCAQDSPFATPEPLAQMTKLYEQRSVAEVTEEAWATRPKYIDVTTLRVVERAGPSGSRHERFAITLLRSG